jgi:hypothetical protein
MLIKNVRERELSYSAKKICGWLEISKFWPEIPKVGAGRQCALLQECEVGGGRGERGPAQWRDQTSKPDLVKVSAAWPF